MRESFVSSPTVRLGALLSGARFLGCDDLVVQSICSDSRRCRPGDLFAAILGDDKDGHDFADEAIERGASAILTERLLPVSVPQCLVSDSRIALGRICHALAGGPAESLHTIGVTGSRGKTVVSYLIASLLESAGFTTGLATSLGSCDGVDMAAPDVERPHPARLAHWCQRSLVNGCSHAVLEVSSQALARHRTAGMTFDGVVLTNIGHEHLDQHGTLVNYRKIKSRIFSHLKPAGYAVVNADDPASLALIDKLSCPVLTVAIRGDAELTAEVVERSLAEQTFLLSAGSETAPIRTRMLGDWHVMNCLSAAAVGLICGLDLPTIARGLEQVECVPGRMERLECGQPFGVFVDGARSPAAIAAAMKALKRVVTGSITCVIGSPEGACRDSRIDLGQVVERHAGRVVITSDNPGYERPLEIAHQILDGFESPGTAQIIPDRGRAIRWALAQAGPGDAVLIAGKGSDAVQVVGKKRIAFDDRLVAREWLYTEGAKREYPLPGTRLKLFHGDCRAA